jgi:hypothetical protein
MPYVIFIIFYSFKNLLANNVIKLSHLVQLGFSPGLGGFFV